MPTSALVEDMALAGTMKAALEKARRHFEVRATLYQRERLPIMAEETQEAILKLVNENDVTIILAKTGSGKTTQVPQILLDDMIMSNHAPRASVVCTQPRRIAATSIAHRVAQERHDLYMTSVGYQIRNDNASPLNRRGCITYCTTGILLNRLIADEEKTLSAHSHIIVDEVHERDIQIDLVLALLRNGIRTRKAAGRAYPKVLLMSATIDPSSFLDYLTRPADNGTALTADCLDVEGRHMEIQDHYLPEILQEMKRLPMIKYVLGKHYLSSKRYVERELAYAGQQAFLGYPLDKEDQTYQGQPPNSMERVGLAASMIAHIAANKPEGDILAFFPGFADFKNVEELLRKGKFVYGDFDLNDTTKFRLFKLHSTHKDTNNEVFQPVPEGCRRIILATNIAETSITLPEVVYVVDGGMVRARVFDHSTLARSLPYVWISKTSSIQRRGRAGRVRNGHYYALFTKARLTSFPPMNRPEIRVADLAQVALQFKAFQQHSDVEALLLDTIDPPSRVAVANALQQLHSLSALTDTGSISSLGRLVSQLGVHPALGKAILLGSLFGCLEPMLIIACHDPGAALISNPHMSKERIKEIRQQYSVEYETDFAWIIEAFREYHAADPLERESLRVTKQIRDRAYLDMIMSSEGIHTVLARAGFVPAPQSGTTLFDVIPPALNTNRHNIPLVKALLISTVSADLAVWPEREENMRSKWRIDIPLLKGLRSRIGINEARTKSDRGAKDKYRSYGRLMAYSYKEEAPGSDNAPDAVFLEQASMTSPLIAILFCRSVALEGDQIMQLNNWLRIQFKVSADVPAAVAEHTGTILMELRKTIDRFTNLAWLELERVNLPEGVTHDPTSSGQQRKNYLGSKLRKVMVEAVLKVIESDEAHWEDFRMKRRAEIAEEARLAEELREAERAAAEEEAGSSPTDEMQSSETDGDDYELEDEAAPADISLPEGKE